jgi:hypothetical protein
LTLAGLGTAPHDPGDRAPVISWAQAVVDTLDGATYREITRGPLSVRYAPRDSLVAPRVLTALLEAPPLPGLRPGVPSGVTVLLAHSPEAFDEATGGGVPEWRAAVALPELGLLVVPTGEGRRVLDPGGLRTLRHEWAHVGLYQEVGGLRAPRWFDEGYAQWASGGFDALQAWRLRVLIALGRTPRFDSLTLSWPRDRAAAETAYLLAASAVTYLLRESGERGLRLFFERWRAAGSFEAGLRGTFGVTSGQLEEDWRRHVRDRYGWLFVVSHSSLFWLMLATSLLLMWRVRARLNRERLARLRADEVAEHPAFWEEDAGNADPPTPTG